jgi:hypothetical protein
LVARAAFQGYHERMNSDAYTPPPSRKKHPQAPGWVVPGVALVAVAALAAVARSRPAAPAAVAPVLAAPIPSIQPAAASAPQSAARVLISPEQRVSYSAPPAMRSARVGSGPDLAGIERQADMPALAWAWPSALSSSSKQRLDPFGGTQDPEILSYTVSQQRLAGWDASRPFGARGVFHLQLADGRRLEVGEAELAAKKRELESKRLALLSAGAPLARGIDPEFDRKHREACALEKAAGPQVRKDLLRGTIHTVTCDPERAFGERHLYRTEYANGRVDERRASPLVLDLTGKGVQTDESTVLFDVDGLGNPEKTQWINDLASGQGLLVFDADGDGVSGENGKELFGDRIDLGDGRTYAHGFAALEAFVAKARAARVIENDGRALRAPELRALEKAYGFKLKIGGFNAPAVSFAKAGVTELVLSNEPVERVRDFDGRGNDVSIQKGATFARAGGARGAYVDVWLVSHRKTMLKGKPSASRGGAASIRPRTRP